MDFIVKINLALLLVHIVLAVLQLRDSNAVAVKSDNAADHASSIPAEEIRCIFDDI